MLRIKKGSIIIIVDEAKEVNYCYALLIDSDNAYIGIYHDLTKLI